MNKLQNKLNIVIPFLKPSSQDLIINDNITIKRKRYSEVFAFNENVIEPYVMTGYEVGYFIKFRFNKGQICNDPWVCVIETGRGNLEQAMHVFYITLVEDNFWKYGLIKSDFHKDSQLKLTTINSTYPKPPLFELTKNRRIKIKDRFDNIVKKNKSGIKKFQISCSFWFSSVNSYQKVNRLLDCLTSLEALSEDTNGALALALSSFLLLRDGSVLSTIYKSYKLRSSILHGSKLKKDAEDIDDYKLLEYTTKVLKKYMDNFSMIGSDDIIRELIKLI